MSPESAILQDLTAGQSTASSIAGRLDLHQEAAAIILKRLETEGLITSFQITTPRSSTGLCVFRLTTAGHEIFHHATNKA